MVLFVWEINIMKTCLFKYILPPKNENFQIKNSDIFHISAQHIDCGYSLELPQWGSSNEYPQSTFLSGNKNEAYGPWLAHLSDIAIADMQMLCNIFPIIATNEKIII